MALQRSRSAPALRAREPAEARLLGFLRRQRRAQSAPQVGRKAEAPVRPTSAPRAKPVAIRERLVKRIATGCHVAFLGAKIKDLPGLGQV